MTVRGDDLGINDRIIYAFGHLAASYNPDDPHHGDSRDLAIDVLHELGISEFEFALIDMVAEHVAGNYEYTGAAINELRALQREETQ